MSWGIELGVGSIDFGIELGVREKFNSWWVLWTF